MMYSDQKESINARLLSLLDEFREYSTSNDVKESFLVLYVLRYLSSGCHSYQIPQKFTIEKLLSHGSDGLDARLMLAWECIESTNTSIFDGIFDAIDFQSRMWGEKSRWQNTLYRVLTDLQSIPFEEVYKQDSEIFQSGFNALLDYFYNGAHGNNAGENYTPVSIGQLLVKLINPTDGMSVYDPACGSAGFLVEAANLVRSDNTNKHTLQLEGQDINLNACMIAKLNLIVNELSAATLHQKDCLSDPIIDAAGEIKTYDRVMSNPPFGMKKWIKEDANQIAQDPRFYFGVPPDSSADYAFIQHIVASLNSHGQAAMILSNGALTKEGAEKKIRESIMEEGIIDAVISLPANLFSHTKIQTNILILKKESKNKDIVFIDASEVYESAKRQNILSPDNVENITSLYKGRKNVTGKSRVVNIEEIRSNDFSLQVSRYVQEEYVGQQVPLQELIDKQNRLEEECFTLQRNMKILINDISE